jgi:hypothetical protein
MFLLLVLQGSNIYIPQALFLWLSRGFYTLPHKFLNYSNPIWFWLRRKVNQWDLSNLMWASLLWRVSFMVFLLSFFKGQILIRWPWILHLLHWLGIPLKISLCTKLSLGVFIKIIIFWNKFLMFLAILET